MKPIQPLLATTIAAIVRPAPLTAEKVLFAWRTAVGAAVARVTAIRLSPERALDVELVDERWCDELERSLPTVLQRMQDMLGSDHLERVRVHRPQPRRRVKRRHPGFTPVIGSGEGESS